MGSNRGGQDPGDRMQDAASAAMQGYARAAQLVTRPDKSGWSPATTGPSGFNSSIPWNHSAAYAMTGLHEFARRAEAELRADAGLPARPRGGSDANTGHALDAICDLALAVPDCKWVVEGLEYWALQSDLLPAVGEAYRWEPLPRVKGQPPMACPYCKLPSLRCAPSRYLVMCRTVDCEDDRGRRPVARASTERGTGIPVLEWTDGLITGPQ